MFAGRAEGHVEHAAARGGGRVRAGHQGAERDAGAGAGPAGRARVRQGAQEPVHLAAAHHPEEAARGQRRQAQAEGPAGQPLQRQQQPVPRNRSCESTTTLFVFNDFRKSGPRPYP